jgi:hypothetical protein
MSEPSQFSEMSLDELADILSLTIKHDNENKIVTFLAMLSAYTDANQINISFNAPSSSGKTYMATEIAKLFPKEDKIELSGASPTSFFYMEGDDADEGGDILVNLERKILIFYEMPNSQLQAKLRSVLSHDQREMRYQITNKGKKGQNRAQQITVRGFPSSVFCSAALRIDEQEATRAILLSPEVTDDKLREGVHLQAWKHADKNEYTLQIEADNRRQNLMRRIVAIRDENVDDILIPNYQDIEKRFNSMVGAMKPRHMRDMGHVMDLIKAIALLNVWYRKQPNGTFLATQSDVNQAFSLWEYFSRSLELGISPALLSFYENFIVPAYYEMVMYVEANKDNKENSTALEYFNLKRGELGISRADLIKYHISITGRTLNEDYLRKQIIPQLEAAGIIQEAKASVGDKRSKHIFPLLLDDDNIGSSSITESDEDTVDLEGTEQNIGQLEVEADEKINVEMLPF